MFKSLITFVVFFPIMLGYGQSHKLKSGATNYSAVIVEQNAGCNLHKLTVTIKDPTGIVLAPNLFSYLWQPSARDSAVLDSVKGNSIAQTYSVQIFDKSNNQYVSTASISIPKNTLLIPQIKASALAADTLTSTIMFNDLSQSKGAAITSWLWLFGNGDTKTDKNPSYHFSKIGKYNVKLILTNAANCIDSAQLLISINDINTIYIPSTFTPNNDGINDQFRPIGSGASINNYDFKVFDRSGNMVFHTKDFYEGWNGRVQNKSDNYCKSDVYTYEINLQDLIGTTHQYLGKITLIQ